MTKMEILRSLRFGQRVAEEERGDLEHYFVETDDWQRLYSGEIDVVYGSKGAGKSALYSLLNARRDDLFDRAVLLAPAENVRGTPAFQDLVADPPASETEFVNLWKLYFACLLSDALDAFGVGGEGAQELRGALAAEGLVKGDRTLKTLLRSVLNYARAARPNEIEASIEVDPHSGLPKGFSGRIAFQEPSTSGVAAGVRSVESLIALANRALGAAKYSVWLLLDRLDVAFAESPELEQNALRALFRVYLDIGALEHIELKIFLRTDIWRRITSAGFREASHITRHMTISWNERSLLNLIARRAAQNETVLTYYGLDKDLVLATAEAQERFIYSMFPPQVDVGPNKQSTFGWLLSRTRDGSKKNAPRELIHLLNALREVQIRRLEVGEAEPADSKLFARAVFKEALPEVSQTRLEQTLYAEYPRLRDHLENLRKKKTAQTASTLASIWGLEVDQAADVAKQLVVVGFFEQRGDDEYWVPFLYRDALDLVQGSEDAS